MARPKPTGEEQAAVLGTKLGALISALEVSDDVRSALVEILPELNMEQLEQLAQFLATSAVQAGTASLDAELKREVERMKADYDTADAKLAAAATAELEAVATKLKAPA